MAIGRIQGICARVFRRRFNSLVWYDLSTAFEFIFILFSRIPRLGVSEIEPDAEIERNERGTQTRLDMLLQTHSSVNLPHLRMYLAALLTTLTPSFFNSLSLV